MQKLFEADFFYQYLQHKINLMGKMYPQSIDW